MELKKSLAADLEQSRHTRWLMGLVLALAVVVAALEYTSSDNDMTMESEWGEDIVEELAPIPIAENDARMVEPESQVRVMADEFVEVNDPTNVTNDIDDENVITPPPLDISMEIDPSIDDIVLTQNPMEMQYDGQEPLPMRVVEQIPQFPGGMLAFIKWLTQHLRYPETARRQNIQGTVVASFVVNADGGVTDVKIVSSVNPMLDRETLRVVRMMPKWEPGIFKGEPCRTLVYLPVEFKL